MSRSPSVNEGQEGQGEKLKTGENVIDNGGDPNAIMGMNIVEGDVKPYAIPKMKGDKTIKCWNCDTIMMVKEDWKVVQCPTCEKVCKIPQSVEQLVDSVNKILFNSNINHFDVNMPTVFAIVLCPFCKTENKIRRGSEHVVCFKCHNSVNIVKEDGKVSLTTGASPAYFSLNPNSASSLFAGNNVNNNANYPLRKSLRFSDMFFPDPMFYPGYYPIGNSYSPLYPPYDQYAMQEYLMRKHKYNMFQYHLEKEKNNKGQSGHVREPVMQQLRAIQESLGGKVDSPRKVDNNRVNDIKENLINDKRNKNEAVYKSLFSRGGK